MSQFFTLPTKIGQGLISNAIAYDEPLTIATMAIGDGGGKLPSPDASVTRLVNEVRRGPINQVTTDPDNPNWIIAEQVLPPDVGGWTIREVGLYDTDGNLIAYGNYPETYKPQLSEGSSRTQTIRFVLETTDTSAVTLRIDPSVVMASRKYVDDQLEVHAKSRNHPAADTKNSGMMRFATLAESRKGEESKAAQTPAGGMAQLDDHRAEKEAHDAGQIALAEALEKFAGAGTVQAVLAMLGTGALKNIGSAAGDLLSVGDFGVGVTPGARPCYDIDKTGLIGRYYSRGDQPEYVGDHPFSGGYVLDVTSDNAKNIVQTARADYAEGFAQRVCIDNGWRAWEYFAGLKGSLSSGSGTINIPYYNGRERKTLILQLFRRIVSGPGTNINDTIVRSFSYPVAFPSGCYKLLVSTLDDPDGPSEGSEVSTALVSYHRTAGAAKLTRVRGSNESGTETLILDCLAIGE